MRKQEEERPQGTVSYPARCPSYAIRLWRMESRIGLGAILLGFAANARGSTLGLHLREPLYKIKRQKLAEVKKNRFSEWLQNLLFWCKRG